MALAATLFGACMNAAAASYSLPPPILWSIAEVEGGYEGAEVVNLNRSVDMGIMQINSANLGELSSLYGVDRRFLADKLINDGCFNIKIGAWLLRRRIDEAGDFWTGVGWYHSHTRPLAADYIHKVGSAAVKLYGPEILGGER